MTDEPRTAAVIREARKEDAAAIAAIYAHYVRTTLVTFETEAPSATEMANRMGRTLESYPYLVVEEDGVVMGYCYASAFRPRAAYQHAAEASIYLSPDRKGRGHGSALYERLMDELRRQNVFDVYACIAYRDQEDALLDHASVRFHEKMGFVECGRFRSCGHKLGTWCDMVWMARQIAPRPKDPEPFIPRALLVRS